MTEAALRATAAAWLAAGRSARVVQVLRHRGSVPREAGTRMLVAADAVAGTIGGGHLEWQAIQQARVRLRLGEPAAERDIALGPTLGQCCGGALTLRDGPLDAAALAAWPLPVPLFTLQLYGAGHVGRAIVALLAGIDCRVMWIDERDEAFPAEAALPPHIEHLCVEPAAAEVQAAAPGSLALIMTHSHELDLAICAAALRSDDLAWVGLIGSATKRARFERRLLDRGVAPERVAALACPIGVPGVTGKQPEVVAVAVVAQLLQVAGRHAAAAGQTNWIKDSRRSD
ncbi:xanthine dehydrogenase accessory protein XdhC [Aquabacterium sp. OR-4]|uniref:xanthine dehydrogenase accessory protein XdhC n=1 Tax=Aquabacterium sp. OR-4 TaxID=2978127 RepID=UPI0021B2CF9A|nr:xanthine dehydrogenase accessory protein XdhC [Aquabacterium sp. OR-4]MDT7837065.1 xanthine dehydrogenase accessory protein XdhC [Aquabacterium sp. OR-4]